MATVSEDLIQEGTAVLAQRNAEEIQKFGDRIISVEPDNWYGLFARGCGYALEHDFSNTIINWKSCMEHLDDEETVAQLCPQMVSFLTDCILHLPAGERLDFSNVSELLNSLNDKLPESDEEVFVTAVLAQGAEYLKTNAVDQPMLTYFAYKAMAISGFRCYVELSILLGFLEKVTEINRFVRDFTDGKMGNALDNDKLFLDEMCAAMRAAIDNCPEEDLEKIEEYWLEHKIDSYVSHVLQAYQMSAAVATAGKITSKIAKKVMLTEVQTFIKIYLSPKI